MSLLILIKFAVGVYTKSCQDSFILIHISQIQPALCEAETYGFLKNYLLYMT
jgi:hypothetical protein